MSPLQCSFCHLLASTSHKVYWPAPLSISHQLHFLSLGDPSSGIRYRSPLAVVPRFSLHLVSPHRRSPSMSPHKEDTRVQGSLDRESKFESDLQQPTKIVDLKQVVKEPHHPPWPRTKQQVVQPATASVQPEPDNPGDGMVDQSRSKVRASAIDELDGDADHMLTKRTEPRGTSNCLLRAQSFP